VLTLLRDIDQVSDLARSALSLIFRMVPIIRSQISWIAQVKRTNHEARALQSGKGETQVKRTGSWLL
jgi:hypothetical protein